MSIIISIIVESYAIYLLVNFNIYLFESTVIFGKYIISVYHLKLILLVF